MLKTALKRIWDYFTSMNSDKATGEVSIKRNMAWGIATLLVVSELFTDAVFACLLFKALQAAPQSGADRFVTILGYFVDVAKFFHTVDAIFVSLCLGITSLEKIQSVIQAWKGDKSAVPIPENEPIEQPKENL